MYLIHIYDDRARIMARLVAIDLAQLDKHLETIAREFPGCNFTIARKT
jgi:hypothetical protein